MKTKLEQNNAVHPQLVEVPEPLIVHPSVSPLAAELLMKTADRLAHEPHRYNQSEPDHECGAPCCILGHMRDLAGVHGGVKTPDCDGRLKEIGLTVSQADSIYWRRLWPKGSYADIALITPREGIARIEHFLRTGQ